VSAVQPDSVSKPNKRRKRRRLGYRPAPIPPDYNGLDVSIGQAMAWLDASTSTVQRLCKSGEIESYVLGRGKRRIVFESLKSYRDRCRALGPQFGVRPKTGKRPVGRPRKPRPEASQAG
jgi:hypothetical protein